MKSVGISLLVTGGLLVSSAASAQTVRCEIRTKHQCDAQGCQNVSPSVWDILDLKSRSIARCDSKRCDAYLAQFSTSGNYVNISVPDRGFSAKMSSDGSAFTEIATLGTTVLVSFGSCRTQ